MAMKSKVTKKAATKVAKSAGVKGLAKQSAGVLGKAAGLAVPGLNLALAAMFLPDALGMGRDLLENVGLDPTGRKRRATRDAISGALGSQDLTSILGGYEENVLSDILPTMHGAQRAADVGSPALSEALDILGDEAFQLRRMSARSRPSMASMMARAGLS